MNSTYGINISYGVKISFTAHIFHTIQSLDKLIVARVWFNEKFHVKNMSYYVDDCGKNKLNWKTYKKKILIFFSFNTITYNDSYNISTSGYERLRTLVTLSYNTR